MSKRNVRFESGAAKPSNEEIAVVAYSLFEAEGKVDGHDLEHWLQAKEQLSKDRSSGKRSQNGGLTSRDAKQKVFSITNGKRSVCEVAQ